MWLRELPENILTEHLLRAYLENTSNEKKALSFLNLLNFFSRHL